MIALLPLAWSAGVTAEETLAEPYKVDSKTLHLWHLDETRPPFVDAVPDGLPLLGILNGARPGQRSMLLLGSAISFNACVGGTPGSSDARGAILTAGANLDQGGGDNAPQGFRYFGEDGAFTMEMVVKLDMLPKESPYIALDLLTMEGDGSDRIFNFRIEKEGFLVFVPLPHCGASGGGIAMLPTSGPHKPDTTGWFHVAVTYNGNAGAANNLKLYWTRMDSGAAGANCIGTGTLSNDLNGVQGDLAIGNEARGFEDNAEAEPFPGLIDEVRISSVARHATDFLFVPLRLRQGPVDGPQETEKVEPPPELDLKLLDVLVDSSSTPIPGDASKRIRLGPGLHRLDFDFGFLPEDAGPAGDSNPWENAVDVKLRCQLEGIDDQWQETDAGMSLAFQVLDEKDRVISQARFPATGRSDGWKTTLEDSVMVQRIEPVFIPAEARKVRLVLNSGSPDTTGFFGIDYFGLQPAGSTEASIFKHGEFVYNAYTTSPAGSPTGWQRGGSDPSIARMILRSGKPGIGLVDGDQTKSGEWTCVETLLPEKRPAGIYSFDWWEAYNVIGGSTHRATYVNVPPGDYTFRAIGLAGDQQMKGGQISLGIHIAPPFWQQLWFLPTLTAGFVAVVIGGIFSGHRQRAKRSMERLRFQNALEKDRSRIARDMHDDLGSRATFINMSAALAEKDLESSPENARRHLSRMAESAKDLIVAMDGLVWAVDPAHDTLDHLASHLNRLAEDMFRDSGIRCRLDIPPLLPPIPLGSEVRHHIAMAVKESFHNILRHAGACEAFFSLSLQNEAIRIMIRDTGKGFDVSQHATGNGLGNLKSRLEEIGGTCKISSSPGFGTTIVLICKAKDSPLKKTR